MEKGKEKTKIEFVIDTNILISTLIPKKTKLRDILLSGDFRIYAPEYLLKELDKYWNLILEKSGTGPAKSLEKGEIEVIKWHAQNLKQNFSASIRWLKLSSLS
ncbi:MAG: PIN domain-containing protein [Methanobacteriota archaeon]